MVAHEGRLRDAVAQPVDETEEEAGIGTGLAGRTRIDGLHNRDLYRQPKMHHFVHAPPRVQVPDWLLGAGGDWPSPWRTSWFRLAWAIAIATHSYFARKDRHV
ncbi:hypothetical protein MyNCGM683_11370 [Achromobacter xylosoxidans]